LEARALHSKPYHLALLQKVFKRLTHVGNCACEQKKYRRRSERVETLDSRLWAVLLDVPQLEAREAADLLRLARVCVWRVSSTPYSLSYVVSTVAMRAVGAMGAAAVVAGRYSTK
jgi:hypothetical protein